MENRDHVSLQAKAKDLLGAKRHVEALELLEAAAVKEPLDGDLLGAIGECLASLGKTREAIDAYNAACYFSDDPSQHLSRIGDLHASLQEYDQAITCFRHALAHSPINGQLHASIAMCLFQSNHIEAAYDEAELAIEMTSDRGYAHYVMGIICLYNGNLLESTAALRKAINIEPGLGQAHAALGIALLSQGNYNRSSWEEYAWRLRIEPCEEPPEPYRKLPQWDGEASAEARLLVWCEQGLGDCIFSLRFLSQIGLQPKQIFLIVDHRITKLCMRSLPGIKVYGYIETNLNVNRTLAICSAGMFAHLDSPANTQGFSPYLSGDEDLAVNFREELFRIAGSHSKRLVGVSWWSDISRSNGKEKSIPLSALADLARIPDLTLIDLQYGNTQAEREEFSRLTGKELVSLPFDKKNDLESLTALIQACDCIVTISNVTAHLAGAMGKEGYVLLPAGKGLFWYWQRKVSRSAWYPTLQLIRQQNLGSWEDVVLKLVQELKSNDRCGSVSEDA